jgi:hypothetical protein
MSLQKKYYGVSPSTGLLYILINRGNKSEESCLLEVDTRTRSVYGSKVINVNKAIREKSSNNGFGLIIFKYIEDAKEYTNSIINENIEIIDNNAERDKKKMV